MPNGHRVYKFTEYERAGVREYWIVDPRPHQQQADFYVLGDDGAFSPAPLDENGIYHATVLPHFWLKVAWLWQKELPNSQLVLAEFMLSVPELPAEARAAYQAFYNYFSGKQ
ncbi:MAG: Uma2 family endonuclease [Chloroflexi bacterium]|nr:Uma2 family endonuclease [Chloroflexota bacterium]MCI0576859.1 Uma2 family endonuclease [Chloroflexota bacterium]MCI0643649.1 Uma2 family endonuclease [Chloroflexota bacterium]